MKLQNLLITSVLILSITQTVPVFAEGPQDLINDVNRLQKKQAQVAEIKQDELAKIIKRANTEIDRRVDKLNKLLQRIQNDQKLSADEKTNLSTDIQGDINGLTTLKAKIDADTDLATARSDAKQIFTNFRVFAIVLPKTRLLIAIDNLQAVATKISGFTPKIQDLINNLKGQGKDVTQLQASLDDINTRLTSINSTLASDKTLVLGITVSTTNPKSTFEQVKKDLAGVRQSLAQIRKDFAQMRDTFRIIITGGNSDNTSASVGPKPSPSPTATP